MARPSNLMVSRKSRVGRFGQDQGATIDGISSLDHNGFMDRRVMHSEWKRFRASRRR